MELLEKSQTTLEPHRPSSEREASESAKREIDAFEKTENTENKTENKKEPIETQKPEKVEIEAYWIERKRYLKEIKKVPELRRRYAKEGLLYLMRRFLWSFAFFPIFTAFWVPLVLNRFNLVATVKGVLPSLQSFVDANPQSQAATLETLVIAWLSIGMTFAIFDFIISPFKSPYAYEADVHMRSWETLHLQKINKLR